MLVLIESFARSLNGVDQLEDDDEEEEELVAFRPGANTNEKPTTLHSRAHGKETTGWGHEEEEDDEALFSRFFGILLCISFYLSAVQGSLGRGVETKKDR